MLRMLLRLLYVACSLSPPLRLTLGGDLAPVTMAHLVRQTVSEDELCSSKCLTEGVPSLPWKTPGVSKQSTFDLPFLL
ncbi:hypothetical protein R1flu_028590 [Riccia fluitans]|uniref:Secreted protein n=1 Tax=Riccia fluitans TaxID=41844 RepID=A0ABD1XM76_9MARC